MSQQTFAEVLFEQYRKPTRREWFLDEMNRVVPWTEFSGRDRAGLSQGRGAGASAGRCRTHAASPLSATVVQPVGSGSGGGLVRLTGHAAIRKD